MGSMARYLPSPGAPLQLLVTLDHRVIDVDPHHLGNVQQIRGERIPDCEVRSFGSRPKWTARGYSGANLCIVAGEPLSQPVTRQLVRCLLGGRPTYRRWLSATGTISVMSRKPTGTDEMNTREQILKDHSILHVPIRFVQLGQLCKLRGGYAFPKASQGKRNGKYPFIKVSDMNRPENSIFINGASNWIDDIDVDQLRVKPLPSGTTVFAKIGEALKQNRRRLLVRPTVVDNNMMGAMPYTDHVDARYLYYALSEFDFADIAGGTALPYLTIRSLSSLRVSLPPMHVQRAIANVLGTIDDKINSVQNESLRLQTIRDLLIPKLLSGELQLERLAEQITTSLRKEQAIVHS